MSKRCPPGVICIENVTIVVLFLIILLLIYYFFRNNGNVNDNDSRDKSKSNLSLNSNSTQEIIVRDERIGGTGVGMGMGMFPYSYNSFSNFPNDIYLNPYTAPLRDDRYFPMPIDPRGMIPIPINVSTQGMGVGVDSSYRQVGILKRMNGNETILPLMGRPLFTNRDKWQFYTMNENNIKLPITHKQKSCTSEYGCDNIYNGDTVYVDGIDAAFKATVYDNAVFKYIPFL
jgi:hypothetical protein